MKSTFAAFPCIAPAPATTLPQAVAYLATADFVTGQILVVDGGRSLV